MEETILLFKAVRALGIDVPILAFEQVSETKIHLTLLGGRQVAYDAAGVACSEAGETNTNPRKKRNLEKKQGRKR